MLCNLSCFLPAAWLSDLRNRLACSGTPQENCSPSCLTATLMQWCGQQPPVTLHTLKLALGYDLQMHSDRTKCRYMAGFTHQTCEPCAGTRSLCNGMGYRAAAACCWHHKRQSCAVQPGTVPEGSNHGQAHSCSDLCLLEWRFSAGHGSSRQTGTPLLAMQQYINTVWGFALQHNLQLCTKANVAYSYMDPSLRQHPCCNQKGSIMGKHTCAVICASCNGALVLAMGAADKQVLCYLSCNHASAQSGD